MFEHAETVKKNSIDILDGKFEKNERRNIDEMKSRQSHVINKENFDHATGSILLNYLI